MRHNMLELIFFFGDIIHKNMKTLAALSFLLWHCNAFATALVALPAALVAFLINCVQRPPNAA